MSVTIISPAKTAEPTEMLFGMWIPGGGANEACSTCRCILAPTVEYD